MQQTFTGTLTAADTKKHIAHAFMLPEGVTRLRIALTHAPDRAAGQRYPNQISLSLFAPDGCRGARHNNRDQRIVLTAGSATPGYTVGPLTPGEWQVVIDTHRLLPPDPVQYSITVEADSAPVTDDPAPYVPGHTAPRGPGWYRGDLHGHTLHSDGSWDVPDLLQYARDFQLDFVTLTDHNTVSGLAQLDSLAADDVLTMGGLELTTYYGHALVLGTRRWHEWRVSAERTMDELARAALASGALFVIAHPMSPGDPACTGCDWQYADMRPGSAPAVEVWNGLWAAYNERGLALYYEWLNAGHRLVATAGTDIHGAPPPGVRGAAANVVYAEALSEAAILDAIRQGHLYLSSGPTLALHALAGEAVMMGDLLPVEGAVVVTARWGDAAPTDRVRLICNGRVEAEKPADAAGEAAWEVAAGRVRWCALELRDGAGVLRALTNPIFLGEGWR